MGFFGNNDFDNLIENFFGNSSENFKKSPQGTKNMPVNKIEFNKKIFFIFDFFSEDNLKVNIEEKQKTNEYDERIYGKNKVLTIFNSSQKIAEYILPEKLKIKTIEHTFNNGILEVSFEK